MGKRYTDTRILLFEYINEKLNLILKYVNNKMNKYRKFRIR